MKALIELKIRDLLKEFNMNFEDLWEMYKIALREIDRRSSSVAEKRNGSTISSLRSILTDKDAQDKIKKGV